MTSNYKISLLAALLALAMLLPGPATAQPSVMQRGDLIVTGKTTLNDVVVADGNLTLSGAVRGSVFVVNGDVLLNAPASVDGNITVLGGDLWVSRGAGVDGEINVFSGKAHVEEGARVGSEVRALEEVSSLTPEKIAVVSRYILFNRAVPPESYPLSELSNLDLSDARLRKERDRTLVQLSLFDLGNEPLDSEVVDDSREVIYRGHGVWVRVAAIRFKSADQAENFWDRIRDRYEEKTTYSVHNSLGDGAHWFFRYRGTGYCLWLENNTLMAVMVRHHDHHPESDEWAEVDDLRDRIILKLQNSYSGEVAPTEEKNSEEEKKDR